MAKQNSIIEAGTNLVKKTKKATETKSSTSSGVGGAAGAVAAVGKSSGSSNSNYTRDSEGKWYDAKTGEPLGTGGTNAQWSERQGLSSTNKGTALNNSTYESDLDRYTRAQRKAQVDQLKAARTKALANLDVQEQNIRPMYENARNQTSAASQQGARNFAEYLANRGLTNSGAAAQGEVNRLSTLNNNLGNLATQEANAYRDIANQRTAIENDYAANLANANNALTTQYYNNLMNYNEQQRQYQQALQQQALGQYANDYQAYKNSLLAQGYSPNSLEVLQVDALRGQKSNNLYNAGLNNALTNIQAGNINYNNAAALGMTVPQAQTYYQNYVAAQEAARQAEADALAWERQQQLWNNDLKYNQYLLDAQKAEADIRNINSQIAKRNRVVSNPTSNQYSIKEVNSLVKGLSSDDARKRIDSLYNNGQISDATFDYFQ